MIVEISVETFAGRFLFAHKSLSHLEINEVAPPSHKSMEGRAPIRSTAIVAVGPTGILSVVKTAAVSGQVVSTFRGQRAN